MKRLFDLLASCVGIAILAPLYIVIAIWIKIDSQGPVFFRQQRIGRNGEPFRIFKFRTMRPNAEVTGKLTVGSDSRITRAGSHLRKYKIDELPQLFNVVLGDMSLVGPRPEVDEFMKLYPENARRVILSVRPGITDYASIGLFDENTILAQYTDPHEAYIKHILPKKQELYLKYVSEMSFWTDLKIILLTLCRIFGFRFEGNAPG